MLRIFVWEKQIFKNKENKLYTFTIQFIKVIKSFSVKMSMIDNQNNETYRSTMSIYSLLSINEIGISIFKFSSYFDVIALFSTFVSNEMTRCLKSFKSKSIISDILFGNFKKFATKFGLDLHQFLPCFLKLNAVIAGGFALSMFTNELYDSSDIDIYIPSVSVRLFKRKLRVSGLIEYLLSIGYVKINQILVGDELENHNFFEYVNNGLNRKIQFFFHLYYGREYYLNQPTHYTVGRSVMSDYDFTIGMCCIEKSEVTNLLIIKCCHRDHIKEKKMRINLYNSMYIINLDEFKQQSFENLVKYKSRGYHLCDSINVLIPNFVEEFREYEESLNNII